MSKEKIKTKLLPKLREELQKVINSLESGIQLVEMLETGQKILDREDDETKLLYQKDYSEAYSYADMSMRGYVVLAESMQEFIEGIEKDEKSPHEDALLKLYEGLFEMIEYSSKNYKKNMKKLKEHVEKVG